MPHALQRMGFEGGPLRHCGETSGRSQSGLVQGPEMVARSRAPPRPPDDIRRTRLAAEPGVRLARLVGCGLEHSWPSSSLGDAARLVPIAALKTTEQCSPAGSSASQTRSSRCRPLRLGEAGVSSGLQGGTWVLTGGAGWNSAGGARECRPAPGPAGESSTGRRRAGEPCTD